MSGTNNGLKIISTAADGTQGNSDSGGIGGGSGGFDNSNSFSISADGTKVAFNSDASNLVPGDTNGYTDVFVKDLTTGAIVLASTLTGSDVGRSLEPSISPDGTKVAFATTPFKDGSPFGGAQIFINDLVTGTVTLAVTDAQGAKLLQDIVASPVFSPDGTKLAFFTTADLTGVGTSRNGGLYIKDLGSRTATLVSAAAPGRPGNGRSGEAVFSPDGTKIAFISNSTNLGLTPKLGNSYDVYVKDLVSGTVTLVSADVAGQRQGTTYNTFVDSTNPTFSPDGSKVAFQSTANNLVPGDQDDGSDVFIKDLATGAITRVTALADGTSEGGYGPAFSLDGTKVAFWTFATGYSPFPHPGGTSIYIKDLATGAFTLASTPASPATQGVGNSQDPRFSPDGSELLFWSTNEALVATDANGNTADIFVKNLSTKLPNNPPVAVADSYTTIQGTPLTVAAPAGLLANDTDPGGKPLTALLVGNPVHGALTLNSDGSFTYTPALGYSGFDVFTYKASDGTVQSMTATVSLTVTAVNHPVSAVDDSYTVSNAFPSADFLVAAAAGLLANDTSPDGGLVVLGVVANGTVQNGFVQTAAGGRITVFPDGGLLYDQPFSSDAQGLIRYNGTDSFVYRVRDADGSTADATVTLTVGSGINHPVTATDDSYTVSNASPSDDFKITAAAGLLANDTSPDGGLVVLGVVANGTVQNGFVQTAAGGRITVFPDGGLLYDQPFSSDAQGLIRYNGTDSFVYRVRDADGSTADATVTLTVGSGINHPVTATDDSYTVSNASPSDDFKITAAAGLLANDTSPDGGLVVLGVVANGTVQNGFVQTAAGGRITVFPDGGLLYDQPFSSDAQGLIRYNGTDSFVYRVRDADGSTADATVTLTVGSGINHPVTATDDSYTVSNASPSDDFKITAAAGLLANDTSPDGGLVVLGVVANGTVQNGFVQTAAGGRITVFPDGGLLYDQPFSSDAQGLIRYNGTDSFVYRVRDADGSTADATVTLTVGSGINHPVTATDDSYTVSNASPSDDFKITAAAGLLANDTSPDGGLVVLGVVANGTVQNGFVQTAAGGRITVFPDGGLLYDQPFSSDAQGLIRYNGTDSFVYRVRDADGSTADATVTLTVGSGVNHPVTATDDSYTVSNASPSDDFKITAATGLLANDTSPDGGLVVLGVVANGTVQTGFVQTAAGGRITVLPDGGFLYDQPFSSDAQGLIRYNGTDSFVYRVRDADGSTADATVTLTVGGESNHSPVAGDDTLSVAAHAVAAGNLLANDGDADLGNTLVLTAIQFAGGQPLAVAADGSASLAGQHGTLIVGSDGRYSYVGSLAGTDPFSYTLSDGRGGQASANVIATVTAGVAPPADATFGFGFLQSSVSYAGRQAILTGPDGVARDVTGIGHLHFTDGTIDEADGSPLVDDLFYNAHNRDVYAANFDPDAHYAAYGFREGRDPNAVFSTTGYLAANPDVQAAGVNPLQHYDQYGWHEGRDASPDFSSNSYLALNPDVLAAGFDPLTHFLAHGQIEGRNPLPGTDAQGIAGAFDTSYYLAHNPDVSAAGVDPLFHFLTYGWHEGRDPDAYFSTSAYLAANPDVAASGIDPLVHYEVYGWTEGRSTSGFKTAGYLGANPDVGAARIDPLQHFLQYGMAEGRHGWEV